MNEKETREDFTRDQILILQACLNNYYEYCKFKKPSTSWEGIASEIARLKANTLDETFEVDAFDETIDEKSVIDGRTLSRLAKGEGKKKIIVPNLDKLHDIRDFLIKEAFLHLSFYKKRMNATIAIYALEKFFSEVTSPSPLPENLNLSGNYMSETRIGNDPGIRKLTFQAFENSPIYDVEERIPIKTQSIQKFSKVGWATLTSFGGMLIFIATIKEDEIGHHMYIAHSIRSLKNIPEILELMPYETKVFNKRSVDEEKSKPIFVKFHRVLEEVVDKDASKDLGYEDITVRDDGAGRARIKQPGDISKKEVIVSNRNKEDELYSAIFYGDAEKVIKLIEEGANINCQAPGSLETPLHVAVAERERRIIQILVKQPDIKFLMKDHEGRLPSLRAYKYDAALGSFLMDKEIAEAGDPEKYNTVFMSKNDSPTNDI